MTLLVKQFYSAKAGNCLEDYEDSLSVDTETRRFAIADGATESSFAREWAQLLTQGFTSDASYLWQTGKDRSKYSLFLDWLVTLQDKWSKAINWGNLPWFAEAKARQGAFASFLCLEMKENQSLERSYKWRAFAIGDCNLFHVREDILRIAFPLRHSHDFGSRPTIISSNPKGNLNILENIRTKHGRWKNGDRFFLCTDALAKWFLAKWEKREKPWSELQTINSQEDFDNLVVYLRGEFQVRNDDMTLITICDG